MTYNISRNTVKRPEYAQCICIFLHTQECCNSISKTSGCLFHNCLARTVVPFSCPSQEIAMSSGHLISILRTYFKIQAHFSGSLPRKLSVCNTVMSFAVICTLYLYQGKCTYSVVFIIGICYDVKVIIPVVNIVFHPLLPGVQWLGNKRTIPDVDNTNLQWRKTPTSLAIRAWSTSASM